MFLVLQVSPLFSYRLFFPSYVSAFPSTFLISCLSTSSLFPLSLCLIYIPLHFSSSFSMRPLTILPLRSAPSLLYSLHYVSPPPSPPSFTVADKPKFSITRPRRVTEYQEGPSPSLSLPSFPSQDPLLLLLPLLPANLSRPLP